MRGITSPCARPASRTGLPPDAPGRKRPRGTQEPCRAQAGRLDAMRESYERDRRAAPPYIS